MAWEGKGFEDWGRGWESRPLDEFGSPLDLEQEQLREQWIARADREWEQKGGKVSTSVNQALNPSRATREEEMSPSEVAALFGEPTGGSSSENIVAQVQRNTQSYPGRKLTEEKRFKQSLLTATRIERGLVGPRKGETSAYAGQHLLGSFQVDRPLGNIVPQPAFVEDTPYRYTRGPQWGSGYEDTGTGRWMAGNAWWNAPEALKVRLRGGEELKGKEPDPFLPNWGLSEEDLPSLKGGHQYLFRNLSGAEASHPFSTETLSALYPMTKTGKFIFSRQLGRTETGGYEVGEKPIGKVLKHAQLGVGQYLVDRSRSLVTAPVSMMGGESETGQVYKAGVLLAGGVGLSGGGWHRPGTFDLAYKEGREVQPVVKTGGFKMFTAPTASQRVLPADVEMTLSLWKDPILASRALLSTYSATELEGMGLPVSEGKLQWNAITHPQIMAKAWGIIEQNTKLQQFDPVFTKSMMPVYESYPAWAKRGTPREIAPGQFQAQLNLPMLKHDFLFQIGAAFPGQRPKFSGEELGQIYEKSPRLAEQWWGEGRQWRAMYRAPISAVKGELQGVPAAQMEEQFKKAAGWIRTQQPEGQPGHALVTEAAARYINQGVEVPFGEGTFTLPNPQLMEGLLAEHERLPLEEEQLKRSLSTLNIRYGQALGAVMGIGLGDPTARLNKAIGGFISEVRRENIEDPGWAQAPKVHEALRATIAKGGMERPFHSSLAIPDEVAVLGKQAMREMYGGGRERGIRALMGLRRPVSAPEYQVGIGMRAVSEEYARNRYGTEFSGLGRGIAVSPIATMLMMGDVDVDRAIFAPIPKGMAKGYLQQQGSLSERLYSMIRKWEPEATAGKTPTEFMTQLSSGFNEFQALVQEQTGMISGTEDAQEYMSALRGTFMGGGGFKATPGSTLAAAQTGLRAERTMQLSYNAIGRRLRPYMTDPEAVSAYNEMFVKAYQPALEKKELVPELRRLVEIGAGLGRRGGVSGSLSEAKFSEGVGTGTWGALDIGREIFKAKMLTPELRAVMLAEDPANRPALRALMAQPDLEKAWQGAIGYVGRSSPFAAMGQQRGQMAGEAYTASHPEDITTFTPGEKAMGWMGRATNRGLRFLSKLGLPLGEREAILKGAVAASPGLQEVMGWVATESNLKAGTRITDPALNAEQIQELEAYLDDMKAKEDPGGKGATEAKKRTRFTEVLFGDRSRKPFGRAAQAVSSAPQPSTGSGASGVPPSRGGVVAPPTDPGEFLQAMFQPGSWFSISDTGYMQGGIGSQRGRSLEELSQQAEILAGRLAEWSAPLSGAIQATKEITPKIQRGAAAMESWTQGLVGIRRETEQLEKAETISAPGARQVYRHLDPVRAQMAAWQPGQPIPQRVENMLAAQVMRGAVGGATGGGGLMGGIGRGLTALTQYFPMMQMRRVYGMTIGGVVDRARGYADREVTRQQAMMRLEQAALAPGEVPEFAGMAATEMERRETGDAWTRGLGWGAYQVAEPLLNLLPPEKAARQIGLAAAVGGGVAGVGLGTALLGKLFALPSVTAGVAVTKAAAAAGFGALAIGAATQVGLPIAGLALIANRRLMAQGNLPIFEWMKRAEAQYQEFVGLPAGTVTTSEVWQAAYESQLPDRAREGVTADREARQFRAYLKDTLPHVPPAQREEVASQWGAYGVTKQDLQARPELLRWTDRQIALGRGEQSFALLGQAMGTFRETRGGDTAEWIAAMPWEEQQLLPARLQRISPVLSAFRGMDVNVSPEAARALTGATPFQVQRMQQIQSTVGATDPGVMSWAARMQGDTQLADFLSPPMQMQREYDAQIAIRQEQRRYRDWGVGRQIEQAQVGRAYTLETRGLQAQLRNVSTMQQIESFYQQTARRDLQYEQAQEMRGIQAAQAEAQFLQSAWGIGQTGRRAEMQYQRNLEVAGFSQQRADMQYAYQRDAGWRAQGQADMQYEYQQQQMWLGRKMQLAQRGQALEGMGIQLGRIGAQRGYLETTWGIQTEMRELGYRQSMAQFEWGARQRGLAASQFAENYALNQRSFQRQTAQRREQMQEGYQASMLQRGWARDDWELGASRGATQFGWQMEDLNRAIRYSRGPQRAQMLRQRERATEMEGWRRQDAERREGRQEQLWALEDERHNKEVKYFEEGAQLQERRLELQKKHFEEGQGLQAAQAEEQKGFFEERFSLETALRDEQKTWQETQLKWQEDDIGRQKKNYEEIWALEDRRYILTEEHAEKMKGLSDTEREEQRRYLADQKRLGDAERGASLDYLGKVNEFGTDERTAQMGFLVDQKKAADAAREAVGRHALEAKTQAEGFQKELERLWGVGFGIQNKLIEKQNTYLETQYNWQITAIEEAVKHSGALDKLQDGLGELRHDYGMYIAWNRQMILEDPLSLKASMQELYDFVLQTFAPEEWAKEESRRGWAEGDEDLLEGDAAVGSRVGRGKIPIVPIASRTDLATTNELLAQVVGAVVQLGNRLNIKLEIDGQTVAHAMQPHLEEGYHDQVYFH
tara:strand:+ start:97 stop:7566 length:7470 start_codon:yes stop_codon:yes gene_type:complete